MTTRTTLLLCRFRYRLVVSRAGEDLPMLAEDCGLLGFTGDPAAPAWLETPATEALLDAAPHGNVAPGQATDFLTEAVSAAAAWRPHLERTAAQRRPPRRPAPPRPRRRPPYGGAGPGGTATAC